MIRIILFSVFAASAGAESFFLPTFNIQQAPFEIESGGGQASFPLGSMFAAEEIDDQVVRFVGEYDDGTGLVTKNLDMALFSNRTPITRTNFLKYVSDGDYLDSFIHRSVANFVIQGGGFEILPGPSVQPVPTDPPIVNEPGISNTLGTISMAKTAVNPDTATSQWFVSTNANSSNLDFQNGGFTVFARITRETLPNALLFNNPTEFPARNLGPTFESTPIHRSFQSVIELPPVEKFIVFRSVSLVPLPSGQAADDTNLTFAITSPPSATIATASLSGNDLLIEPTGSGTGSVSVSATDSVGNEAIGQINFQVGTSYQAWRSANFTGDDLTDDTVSGPDADPDGNGITNLQAFAQGLDLDQTAFPTIVHNATNVRLTYLEQTNRLRLRITTQRSTTLGNDWTEVASTTVSRVATGKPGQKAVTVSLPKSGTKAFYRIAFERLP